MLMPTEHKRDALYKHSSYKILVKHIYVLDFAFQKLFFFFNISLVVKLNILLLLLFEQNILFEIGNTDYISFMSDLCYMAVMYIGMNISLMKAF